MASRPFKRVERRRRERTGYLDPDAFGSAVAALQRRGRRERLHVLSLADFRMAAGGKWDRLNDLVQSASDLIILRHIDPTKDLYTRLDAETACLVMPRSSRQQARASVAAIVRDMSVQLFGASSGGSAKPRIVRTDLSLGEVLGPDSTIRPAVIHDALDKARVDDALPSRIAPPVVQPAVEAPKVPAILPHSLPPVVGTPVPHRDAAGVPDLVSGSGIVSWYEDQLARQAQEARASAQRLASESTLSLVWSPTWVTSTRSIGAFHAQVIRVDREGVAPAEGAHAYVGASPVEALTLDRFVSSAAARELTNQQFGRTSFGLTVPIHWMSLAPAWRDFVRLPFEGCPGSVRRKLLKIEVFGLTASMPTAIVGRLFDPLERLGCDILARLPLTAYAMVDSMQAVRAIGVDLAELDATAPFGDDELFARLALFRDAARQARKACYVWGVRHRPMIARLVGAGFSLVNGPGVMNPIAVPRGVHFSRRV